MNVKTEGTKVVRRSILDQIFREMMNIRGRLDDIEKNMSNWNPKPVKVSESDLISLPDHLRQTFLAVAEKGECCATTVSNLTGRCRAIESNYLNQLFRMGWLNKRRVLKAIYFRSGENRRAASPSSPKVPSASQDIRFHFR